MSFKLCLLHEISVLADIAFMVPTLTNNIHCLTLGAIKSNGPESECCVGSHTAGTGDQPPARGGGLLFSINWGV